jgi:hypothetical protein
MRGSLKSIEDMSTTFHEKKIKKSKQIANNTSIILMREQQTKNNHWKLFTVT